MLTQSFLFFSIKTFTQKCTYILKNKLNGINVSVTSSEKN